MGEALSELGFGYIRQWHLRRGREHLLEGVRLLELAERRGFLSRANRKLGFAYLVTGHPVRAWREFQEGAEIAERSGAFGQL
jgi:hypothetical protein